jgi:ABC-type amino acid transport substrate-binding protein
MSTWLGTARSWRRGLAPRVVILLFAVPFVGSACESDDSGGNRSGSAANPDDKLAIVTGRGTLLLPTDTAYPPASFVVKSAERRPDTECAENELTGPEVDGYDVAVSKAVAAALRLEPCFVTPTFTQQLAGSARSPARGIPLLLT